MNFSFFTLHVFVSGCTISQHTTFDGCETARSHHHRFTTNHSSEIRHRKALLDTSEFHENVFAGIGEEAMMPLDRRRRILTTGRCEHPVRKSDECSFPYCPRRLTAIRRPPKVRFCRDRSDGGGCGHIILQPTGLAENPTECVCK